MVVFNDHKYMFNAGEHTMRSFLQSGRLLRRTKCLFFTQSRTEQMGGLPGTLSAYIVCARSYPRHARADHVTCGRDC